MRIAVLAAALFSATALRAETLQPRTSRVNGNGVERVLLQQTPVPGTNLQTRLYLITVAPGVRVPPHTHPVVGIGYVISGEAESIFANGQPVRQRAGESFQDLANVRHFYRNVSATVPLVFLVAYTVDRSGNVIVLEAQDQEPAK